MAITRREIVSVGDLQAYLEGKKADRVYHYTTYESLVSILSYRCFRITRMDLLNDRAEQELTKMAANEKSYIMSFSNSPTEYVSMWAMYGKPSGIKLRIDFPVADFNESIRDNFYLDSGLTQKIGLHSIDRDPVTKKEYKISDVVYYDRRKNELSHNTKPFPGIAVTEDTIRALAGFIKYDAWEFEKETRLRVLLNDERNDGLTQYIYARLSGALIGKLGVTYNPWISDRLKDELQQSIDRLAGGPLLHRLSANHGEIREL